MTLEISCCEYSEMRDSDTIVVLWSLLKYTHARRGSVGVEIEMETNNKLSISVAKYVRAGLLRGDACP